MSSAMVAPEPVHGNPSVIVVADPAMRIAPLEATEHFKKLSLLVSKSFFAQCADEDGMLARQLVEKYFTAVFIGLGPLQDKEIDSSVVPTLVSRIVSVLYTHGNLSDDGLKWPKVEMVLENVFDSMIQFEDELFTVPVSERA